MKTSAFGSTTLRNTLSTSSNLLEAVAHHVSGKTNSTFGAIIDSVDQDVFPHVKIKEMMKNLYQFYSDYSGARHGNLNAGIRELTETDVQVLSIVSVLFADFLSQKNKS
jgi:hypothetical protein